MVRSRKQSKRMPARKKFKIAQKVREHNRKVKKAAKKTPKRLKKDPGIPNLFPYKEQLLKQLEEKKQQAESDKEKHKLLLRQRQQQSKKKKSLQGLQNDALQRTREFEKKQALQSSPEKELLSVDHRSLRSYYREFRQVVETADVILEVLDARDPLGTRCVSVEQSILAAGTGKKLILVLNKIDLVPKAVVEAWLKHLRNEFPTVAFKASTQAQKRNLSRKKGVETAPSAVVTSSACLGAELLLKLLGNYCRNADIRTSIVVGVVGLPNVGKSSIINSLKRSKTCSVGATPGVTKCLQEVQLDKHVKLIDSPGIVMATGSGDSLVLRNCIKVESIKDALPSVEAILRRCSHLHMMQHYGLPEFSDVSEFLSHLARRAGKLKKGGIPDNNAAARIVLQDWNCGRIMFYTHPPDQHTLPTHISADLVKEWGQAFDLKSLETDEKTQLSGLQENMEAATVVDSAGLMTDFYHVSEDESDKEDSDIEEEMCSDFSCNEEDIDYMEEEEKQEDRRVTVVFQRKRRKPLSSGSTKREEKERERELELNPQVTRSHKKAMKRQKTKPVERQKRLSCVKEDGDVDMKEGDKDTYDFSEYF